MCIGLEQVLKSKVTSEPNSIDELGSGFILVSRIEDKQRINDKVVKTEENANNMVCFEATYIY